MCFYLKKHGVTKIEWIFMKNPHIYRGVRDELLWQNASHPTKDDFFQVVRASHFGVFTALHYISIPLYFGVASRAGQIRL